MAALHLANAVGTPAATAARDINAKAAQIANSGVGGKRADNTFIRNDVTRRIFKTLSLPMRGSHDVDGFRQLILIKDGKLTVVGE
ncbi:hypothetical protein [Herbaspirillum sp. NPDC087042]|uniref:hypothetical protein n=1 Tax=Herbaspirillum sp. NPDC087042 TaxID=3364004 RepID=UPI0037F7446C